MKQHTSKVLQAIATAYMVFVFIYISLAAVFFDVPMSKIVQILLSPSYYLVAIVAFVAGWGIREMQRWSWNVFVISNLMIIYLNADIVSNYAETHHRLLSFIVATLFVFLLLWRVRREILVPYYMPRIRWWESDDREQLEIPVQVDSETRGSFSGLIMDISQEGCFVKLTPEFYQDEMVTLQFTILGHEINCRGLVVWRAQATVTHPFGIGVKFAQLERKQKRQLRVTTSRLKRNAMRKLRDRVLGGPSSGPGSENKPYG